MQNEEYQSYVDGLIIRALRENDEQPLGHLFAFYYNRLYRSGLRWSNDNQLTEHCILEVFYDLWHYRHSLGDIQSLEAYLKTALRRRLGRHLQKKNPLFRAEALEKDDEWPNVFSTESYEDILILQQQDDSKKQLLRAALAQLSPRQREIIHLKYFEELEYTQIAERLDMKMGAVYKLLHDAVQHLKALLTDRK